MMTRQQAFAESEKCLQCFEAPCTEACPAHIDVPSFIAKIRSQNVLGAAEVVKLSNPLANVCGKVCPEEIYCQSVCSRAKQDEPIRIRELHFFATQSEARSGYRKLGFVESTGKKVAVVGGGPAGLACAFELARRGIRATVFDRRGGGGVPLHTIPSFRLAPGQVQDDLKFLNRFFDIRKASISSLAALRQEFDAIFLAVGLGKDRPLGLKGETLPGVLPVLEFLEKTKRRRIRIGTNVIVVGGGNVSLDAAASAMRGGASHVTVLYRRSVHEMKVWRSELDQARAQGVEFRFLTLPVEIVGTRRVEGVKCRRMQLLRKCDDSGRRIPVEIDGSDFLLAVDTIIVAIGQEGTAGLDGGFARTPKGYIAVDEQFQTTVRGVFAGGDAISGEGTIVQAVAHGKKAAENIAAYVSKQSGGGPMRRVRGSQRLRKEISR